MSRHRVKKMVLGWVLLVSALGSAAQAAETISFQPADLAALVHLFKAERNSVVINQYEGVYSPSPALRFFGVEKRVFPIKVTGSAALLGLHFNHLAMLTPHFELQPEGLAISIPIEDRKAAIRSNVGSISVKGVAISGLVGFKSSPTGQPELEVKTVTLTGLLDGSGILESEHVLSEAQKLLLSTTKTELNRLISQPTIQSEILKVMLLWAGMETGEKWGSVVSQSCHFQQSSDGAPEIVYEVER